MAYYVGLRSMAHAPASRGRLGRLMCQPEFDLNSADVMLKNAALSLRMLSHVHYCC